MSVSRSVGVAPFARAFHLAAGRAVVLPPTGRCPINAAYRDSCVFLTGAYWLRRGTAQARSASDLFDKRLRRRQCLVSRCFWTDATQSSRTLLLLLPRVSPLGCRSLPPRASSKDLKADHTRNTGSERRTTSARSYVRSTSERSRVNSFPEFFSCDNSGWRRRGSTTCTSSAKRSQYRLFTRQSDVRSAPTERRIGRTLRPAVIFPNFPMEAIGLDRSPDLLT